jgi:predicted dehydrogenase
MPKCTILFEEAEKEIDVVSICSPNGLHEHAIKSLQAGIQWCEKPMAISVATGK